jgi:hypothetical protein
LTTTTTVDDDQAGGVTLTTSAAVGDPSVLPFTGLDRGHIIALGASALVLGLLMVAGARREEN